MKPASADPFPARMEVRRARRRTMEMTVEDGRFVLRVPLRMDTSRIGDLVAQMREQLWQKMQRRSVYSDEALHELSRRVAKEQLADLDLPEWTTRFSRRQHRRWGSCTVERGRGRIRISAHLIGHPRWVIAHLLLHELIHLVVPDHGPRFRELERRSPDHDRGRGYLEALETFDQLGGPTMAVRVPLLEDRLARQAELFAPESG